MSYQSHMDRVDRQWEFENADWPVILGMLFFFVLCGTSLFLILKLFSVL